VNETTYLKWFRNDVIVFSDLGTNMWHWRIWIFRMWSHPSRDRKAASGS